MAEQTTTKRRRRRSSDGRPTLRDICDAAGVSKATVSRVLNNQPGVGKKVRSRVLATMKKMNYTPRAAARNLSLAKCETIGIVFQDLVAGWPLSIFRGIMSVATGTGYNVLTALSTKEGDEIDLPNRLLAEGRIDGLLWMDSRVPKEAILQMKERPFPFVVLQRELHDPDICTVSVENTHGAYTIVKHLLDLGYRRLLFVTGQPENEDSSQRLRGAMQALQEYGVSIPKKCLLNGHNNVGPAVEAFANYIESGNPPPDAIFAFNDAMAIGIMHWLRNNGYRVPEDVAIVGFDGIDEAYHVGLTTLETPMYELGVLAAQKLMDIIDDPSAHKNARHVLLRGNLAVRLSCGAHLKK